MFHPHTHSDQSSTSPANQSQFLPDQPNSDRDNTTRKWGWVIGTVCAVAFIFAICLALFLTRNLTQTEIAVSANTENQIYLDDNYAIDIRHGALIHTETVDLTAQETDLTISQPFAETSENSGRDSNTSTTHDTTPPSIRSWSYGTPTRRSRTTTSTEEMPAINMDAVASYVRDVTLDTSAETLEDFEDTGVLLETACWSEENTEDIMTSRVSSPYTYETMNSTVWASKTMEVYAGPDVSFDVIGSYARHDCFTVTGRCVETGWFRVSFSGMVGYVSGENMTEDEPHEDIIGTIGTISIDMVESANAQMDLLPETLLQAFVDSGWSYSISQADVDDTYAGGQWGRVKGLTVWGTQSIYLDNREVALTATLHEFGHFVDWYYDWLSSTGDFTTIYYSSERSTFNSVFNYSNGVYNYQELFAEAFKEYFLDPDILAENCPNLYEFMDSHFGDLE